MRRRDGGTNRRGAGDAALDPVVGGDPAGAVPARSVSQTRVRAASDPTWGYYGPCARSSLTARFHHGHASADRRLRHGGLRPMPRAATERRKASPPRQCGRHTSDNGVASTGSVSRRSVPPLLSRKAQSARHDKRRRTRDPEKVGTRFSDKIARRKSGCLKMWIRNTGGAGSPPQSRLHRMVFARAD